MGFAEQLTSDFKQILKHGELTRFRYFTQTIGGNGSYYDDDITLARSGNDVWVSGISQPLTSKTTSHESMLVEQGLLAWDDRRLYIAGSISLSGTVRIGIGSPSNVNKEFRLQMPGVMNWTVEGVSIYQKAYIRMLPAGSYAGE